MVGRVDGLRLRENKPSLGAHLLRLRLNARALYMCVRIFLSFVIRESAMYIVCSMSVRASQTGKPEIVSVKSFFVVSLK